MDRQTAMSKIRPSLLIALLLMLGLTFVIPATVSADPWNSESKHGDPVHLHISREAAKVWPSEFRMDHELWTYLENGANIGGYYTGDDILEGSWEQDYPNADMRWMEHFWDADNSSNPYNYGYDLTTVYDSAYTSALEYWYDAIDTYPTDKALAYYYLGNVAHYLEDMSVPEHVKLHAHATAYTYEKYVTANYTTWNTTSPIDVTGDPVYATSLWTHPADESQPLLFRLFYHINQLADAEACIGDWAIFWEECYSGDARDRYGVYHAEWAGVEPSCPIDSSEFHIQANKLMPLIFQYVGGLYALFWDRLYEPEFVYTNFDDSTLVSGDVFLEADVFNDGGEAGYSIVEYSIDSGPAVEMTYNSGTGLYEGTWDTTGLALGSSHTVVFEATDVFSNIGSTTYNDIRIGDCAIGTSYYFDGDLNPVNSCQVCNASESTDSWTDLDGTSCNDGDDCTHTDVCSLGTCAGTPYTCDDSNVCTYDYCLGDGTCNNVNNSIRCNDNDPCTDDDSCSGGTCSGNPYTCEDFNDCTDNICNGDGTCDFANNTASCDDNQYCTIDDQCSAGTCGGAVRDCNDYVGCTGDSCNEETDQCDHTPDNGFCDNGLWCDGVETCDTVSDCQEGQAPDCNDNVSCTDDSCDEVGDACVNQANDANCDNGLWCDGAESCNPVAGCLDETDPCDPVTQTCNETDDLCEQAGPINLTVTARLHGSWNGAIHTCQSLVQIDLYDESLILVDSFFDVTFTVGGVAQVDLVGMATGSYFVVLRHPNHIDLLTALPITWDGVNAVNVDFTNPANVECGTSTMFDLSGVWTMPAGDIVPDDRVALSDFNYLRSHWTETDAACDLDCDGFCRLGDFNKLRQTWNTQGCAP